MAMLPYFLVLFVYFALILGAGGEVTSTAAGRVLSTNNPPSDEYNIAPIADCSGEIIDLGVQARECFLDCEKSTEPIESATMRVFYSTGDGPVIVECQKLELSQEFTQTWTFSTIKGDLHVTHVRPIEQECRDEIQKHCSDYKCDRREPDNLEEEYHYGSVTKKTSTYVTLISAPSMLFIDNDELMASPAGTTEKFRHSDGTGSHDNSFYFWRPVDALTECPFSMIGEYGCDRFKDKEEDFYVCQGGSIAVTPRSGNKDIWSAKCPGIKLSEEGFVYKMVKGQPKDVHTGRLYIDVTGTQAESEDSSYMRHKLQQIYKRLDADICLNRCELLTVESRLHANESKLIRAGADNYLLMPNGTARYCKPNHGCRLPANPTYCGNPPRISIMCNGYSRYWDPLLPYTTVASSCLKPDAVENLTFSLGTTHYDVSNDLKIKVPNSILHQRYPNEFFNYHNSRLTLHIKDLKDLKKGWDNSRSGSSAIASSQANTTDVDAPHVNIGGKILGVFNSAVTGVKTVEAIIGAAFVLGVVYLTVMVLDKTTGIITRVKSSYSTVPTGQQRRNRAADESMTWI
ncbi:TPA_asm: G [Utricularia alphacytorhabdovirus 1]|nr:TPA_asm: G [Utricularia alphacytorhabdovirus 1]